MSERAEIIEIGPREGLQNHPNYIDVASKVAFIDSFFDAGFEKVEATSFVHPKGMPQMRDACEVLRRLDRRKGKVAQVLVPNETGCRNAIACQAQEIVVWCYLTDELNYLTLNLDRSKTFKEINSIVQIAHINDIETSAWIGGAFGYPGMEIPILCQEAKDTTQSLIQLGCSEVCLSDEFCMANPPLVKKILRICLDVVDKANIVVHFHDNRGLGLANIVAAYEEGIRKFKACIGGAGMHTDLVPSLGNAFSKNMFPSVGTEDLVFVFEEMGIHTGIDIEKLIECGHVAECLLGRKLHSRVIANNLQSIK
jgi:hydroxymethylglutaryl-CoA lyase